MVKKPNYKKWLKIIIAKKKDPKLRNRDLQSMFKTSPNIVVQALKHSAEEIKKMIKEETRFSDPSFEKIENENISIEKISDEGYGYKVNDENRPRREDIDLAKEWIQNILIPCDKHREIVENEFVIRSTQFYTEFSSYNMKHWLEDSLIINSPIEWIFPGTYITNGAFIIAMIESGYTARIPKDIFGPNVYFNVYPAGYFYAMGQTHVISDKEKSQEYGSLRDIEVHNFEGYCSSQYCSSKSTDVFIISLGKDKGKNGLAGDIMIPFCFKHGWFYKGVRDARWKIDND